MTSNFFTLERVNFFELEQTLVQVKKDYRESCANNDYEDKESNLELWEENIMEMQKHYVMMCNWYQQTVNQNAISW